jgi:hypothetical protein
MLPPSAALPSPSPSPSPSPRLQTTYERARGRRARPMPRCIGGRRCLPLRCQTQHERAGSHPCADGTTGRRHWASRFLPSTRRAGRLRCLAVCLLCWLCRVCIESAGMRLFACGGRTWTFAHDKVVLNRRRVCSFPSAFSSRGPMHTDQMSRQCVDPSNSRIQSAAVQYRP